MRPAVEILTQHSWSPDYRTDSTPHLEKLGQLGFAINDHVTDFLAKFGNIEVYYVHHSSHPQLRGRKMGFVA